VQQGLTDVRAELRLSSERPLSAAGLGGINAVQMGFQGSKAQFKPKEVVNLTMEDGDEESASPIKAPLRMVPDAIPEIVVEDSSKEDQSELELESESEPEPEQESKTEPLLTAEGIKDLLITFKRDMGWDHALSTRVILEDSRQGHQKKKPFQSEKSSPFACLRPIHTSKDGRKLSSLGSITVTVRGHYFPSISWHN